MTTRDEWRKPLNPPGPDWNEKLAARLAAVRERARRDHCERCDGEGLHMRHFAYPGECPGEKIRANESTAPDGDVARARVEGESDENGECERERERPR